MPSVGSVEFDKIKGASLEVGPNGWRGTRTALVKDVEGTGADRLSAAVTAVLFQVPIGSPFPGISYRVPLSSVRAEPYGDQTPSQFVATLTYENPTGDAPLPGDTGEYRLSVGGSVEMDTTQFYIEEIPFTDEETGENGLFNPAKQIITYIGDSAEEATSVCAHEVQFPRPMETMELSRRESRTQFFANKRKAYGKVNNADIPEPIGAPKHTLLCTNVQGSSNDGFQYEVTYTFQYNPHTWNAVVPYRDPVTGEIPSDLVPNKGIRRFRVILQANFDDLELWTSTG